MKIVLNRAVGRSFCLSRKAIERLFELKRGAEDHEKLHLSKDRGKLGEASTREWSRHIARNDLDLIRVVQELGHEAAAFESELVIIEVPETSTWHVSDVVGYEFVVADGRAH